MVNYVFEPPKNITSFFGMMDYFNSLTDFGMGSMFWTVILIVISGVLFLTLKTYSVEKAISISVICSAVLAILLRILGWVNDYVVTVYVILAILGIFLLLKESSQYD